jgi:small subunit ribosomal protein S3
MGQKIHPTGFRLAVNRNWGSKWFANTKNFGPTLKEDIKVREYLKKKLAHASVGRITIERPAKNARITIHSARPGVVIGKKGEDIETLRSDLRRMMGGEVGLNIEEIRKPEIDAQLIADSIAQQLQKRIMFRRAMKRAMQNAMRLGAQGIKIMSAGRLNGIEIARRIRKEDPKVGIVFLTTLLNHVLEAYEVHADNYLIKPLRYARFLKEVEQARARRGQNRFFIEKNVNGIYKIYTKSICYIETEEHNTRIHTETDSISSYKRMKEHEQGLFEPYFVRCHTGFIVNLLFFEKLEQNNIVLNTGVYIPVSRQRRLKVLEKINALYTEEAGQ